MSAFNLKGIQAGDFEQRICTQNTSMQKKNETKAVMYLQLVVI